LEDFLDARAAQLGGELDGKASRRQGVERAGGCAGRAGVNGR